MLFVDRILALPKGQEASLDNVLKPSLEDESELRRFFATERAHPRLADPYVGLVDVFAAPEEIRTTRARVVRDEEDSSAKYVMPLSKETRRPDGSPSTVSDLEEFQKNWAIFSEGSLSQLLDWNNVVAAGGSVLACLSPLTDEQKVSKRSIRKYYHSTAYPSSDVDLFLWGLTPEEAEAKIVKIYEAVRDSVPWDVTCVRTKHTVSIHSQYPYRSVQIVLRLYASPAEILAGFDVDAPCCAYDGQHVWANPRSIVAMMRQCNTVDVTRRSPSYEVRLAKYSARGFEVHVPTLTREEIDPCIFERNIASIEGLARLLVFESLKDSDSRYAFLESRRALRGRPNPLNRYDQRRRKRRYKGDLKAESALGGLEMNDYDVATLHIPYGPGWTARRIEKLIYQTDLGMNSTFNPKNEGRRLHRHPAFFGTGPECLEDCCEHCPDPIDDDERKLFEEDDKQYIKGRISFMEDDPGRQMMSGSFNPIDVGEWSGQVYVGLTEKFFSAIASKDRAGVQAMIADGHDVNRRDHVGRSPLHVALLCKAADVACDLIDAGARLTARLVDGRTSAHLAAQMDLGGVLKKILEKSHANKEAAPKKVDDEEVEQPPAEREGFSSEDDWTSEDDGFVSLDDDEDADGEDDDEAENGDDEDEEEDGEDGEEDGEDGDDDHEQPKKKKSGTETVDAGDIPEDDDNVPDVVDVNLPDWDVAFTPLSYAILFASIDVVDTLIVEGADVKLVTKANYRPAPALHPLTLTILRDDEDEACVIAERLIKAGASSSYADQDLHTIFHRAIESNKTKLVSTLLRLDPKSNAVLNFPAVEERRIVFPLVSAIHLGSYSMIAMLLAYGAKYVFTEEDSQHLHLAVLEKVNRYNYGNKAKVTSLIVSPVEAALARRDDILQLLVSLGAEINLGTWEALQPYGYDQSKHTLIDWVDCAIRKLENQITQKKKDQKGNKTRKEDWDTTTWDGYVKKISWQLANQDSGNKRDEEETDTEIKKLEALKAYYLDAQALLESHGAKIWEEVYPDPGEIKTIRRVTQLGQDTEKEKEKEEEKADKYVKLRENYSSDHTPEPLNKAYDQLFEACYQGDNVVVRELCMPKERKTPLQISVEMDGSDTFIRSSGYTPLYAAIAGRRWDTAKLVVSIAIAQYKPDKGQNNTFRADGFDIGDDDADDSDADSCLSEETVNGKEDVDLIDVTNQESLLKCDVSPVKILHNTEMHWPKSSGNLLARATFDNDAEAFDKILELYDMVEDAQLDDAVVTNLVRDDKPELLDKVIRRFGLGLSFEKDEGEEEDPGLEVPVNDKTRVYLGLTVHGKKQKGSRHHHNATDIFKPLVWRAAVTGSNATLDYLASDKPLAAYEFYASRNNDRRYGGDIKKRLGWYVSPNGESPLTTAVMSGHVKTVKKVLNLAPKTVTQTLHNRVKFIGYNLLMIAVDLELNEDMIDYLLSTGVSPALNDPVRGWNIFHILCDKVQYNFSTTPAKLQHLLNKLPRDVCEELLTQQSKKDMKTPLHLAISRSSTQLVQTIVSFTSLGNLARDVNGLTPLATAARKGSARITTLLLDSTPSDALWMENAVGETPLEIAALQELVERSKKTANKRSGWRNYDIILPDDNLPTTPPPSQRGREASELRAMLDTLREEGKLEEGDKLDGTLEAFLSVLEHKRDVEEATEDDQNKLRDPPDYLATLSVLCSAAHACEGNIKRELVHLIDVQRSVQANLTAERVNNKYIDDGDFDAEEPDDKKGVKALIYSAGLFQGSDY